MDNVIKCIFKIDGTIKTKFFANEKAIHNFELQEVAKGKDVKLLGFEIVKIIK